jgi:hypothetical protein
VFAAAFSIVNWLYKEHGEVSPAFEKADTSAAYPYGAMNCIPALAIYSELPRAIRGGVESLKGAHRMGDGQIFLKTSAPLSLIKAF